ncbi:MAG: hypothetical protein WBV25_03075 [Methylocella sp.]
MTSFKLHALRAAAGLPALSQSGEFGIAGRDALRDMGCSRGMPLLSPATKGYIASQQPGSRAYRRWNAATVDS